MPPMTSACAAGRRPPAANPPPAAPPAAAACTPAKMPPATGPAPVIPRAPPTTAGAAAAAPAPATAPTPAAVAARAARCSCSRLSSLCFSCWHLRLHSASSSVFCTPISSRHLPVQLASTLVQHTRQRTTAASAGIASPGQSSQGSILSIYSRLCVCVTLTRWMDGLLLTGYMYTGCKTSFVVNYTWYDEHRPQRRMA